MGGLQHTFGTFGLSGIPFRDANDLYFQQQIVDHWTSFFRTYNHNPDPYYLAVRGFAVPALESVQDGLWQPLTNASSPTIRLPSVPSTQSAFLEAAQCDFFNRTLGFYGRHAMYLDTMCTRLNQMLS